MDYLTVSPEAINAEKKLLCTIIEMQKNLEEESHGLVLTYLDNQYGLGKHSNDIFYLIENVKDKSKQIKDVNKLCRRLKLSIKNRERHLDGVFPISQSTANVKYVAGVMGKIYSSGYRQMRRPSSEGTWNSNVFYPDLEVVPSKYNPEQKSFSQIISDLEKNYGIHYTGTPYVYGYADFSNIAIAQVDFTDIIDKNVQDGFSKDPLLDGENVNYDVIFSNRNRNFRYADEICAERGISIHGLHDGYSASELASWRKENHFTWDESYNNGYLLVPSELHNNIPHTGLVGIATHGEQAEKSIINKQNNSSK